jgi:hypothetical protein
MFEVQYDNTRLSKKECCFSIDQNWVLASLKIIKPITEKLDFIISILIQTNIRILDFSIKKFQSNSG